MNTMQLTFPQVGIAAAKPIVEQEAELLRSARAGDTVACEKIFVTFLKTSKSIAGLLRQHLPNPEDREEMLHEIYLRLISSNNVFRGESRLSTYIFRVARITLFQKFRRENTIKRGRLFRIISDDAPSVADGIQSSPEYTYRMKEIREILSDLIARLPESYAEAIYLRVMEDLSYDEIGMKLSLPSNIVATRIFKGKKILMERLAEIGIISKS
ncbi:RNA polymerase sigma factor [bacterium]|nr:RNA polymerase sigma factor [bacterium]MCI0604545.1 RNA polymerase sigma factor [bacterium]